jgi:carboxyl-terminal processing protease
VGEYVDKNRRQLQSQYPSFTDYMDSFKISDEMMADFFVQADTAGVKKDETGYTASEELIKVQIKGLIAQKLWDLNSFYMIVNRIDPEIIKAVELVEDKANFTDLTQ